MLMVMVMVMVMLMTIMFPLEMASPRWFRRRIGRRRLSTREWRIVITIIIIVIIMIMIRWRIIHGDSVRLLWIRPVDLQGAFTDRAVRLKNIEQ